MAFTANTVFEIRTTGNSLNGGGFATGASGTDWSQQDNPQYSVTDGVTNGTTTITSATANFGTDVVGNVIYVAGGTGSVAANRYSIVSRTNSTTIVVDRSTGLTAGTGVTLRIGGAIDSIGTMGFILNQGQNPSFCWVRGGTYTLTSSTANVSGGTFQDTNFRLFPFIGYGTTRGDNIRPVISTGSLTSVAVFQLTGTSATSGQNIINIEVDGVAKANSNTAFGTNYSLGLNNNLAGILLNCKATRCGTGYNGIGNNAMGMQAIRCEAEDCTVGFACSTDSCIAFSCVEGIKPWQSIHTNSIARDCSSNGFRGTSFFRAYNCLSYRNGGVGFSCDSGFAFGVFNSIAAYNTGAGYNLSSAATPAIFNCASCFNGSADVLPTGANMAWKRNAIITPTVDPFIDRTVNDFRINQTANGGALLLSAGITIPNQLTGNYIGAVQGVYSSGGGGGTFNPLNHPLIN